MTPGRRYDPCGRAVLVALLARPGGATTAELAEQTGYASNSVGTAYALARHDGLIEAAGEPNRWRLTEQGRVRAAALAGVEQQPTQRQRPSFTCPVCSATSYNPGDILHGYCGRCHAYTGPKVCEIAGHQGCTVYECRPN